MLEKKNHQWWLVGRRTPGIHVATPLIVECSHRTKKPVGHRTPSGHMPIQEARLARFWESSTVYIAMAATQERRSARAVAGRTAELENPEWKSPVTVPSSDQNHVKKTLGSGQEARGGGVSDLTGIGYQSMIYVLSEAPIASPHDLASVPSLCLAREIEGTSQPQGGSRSQAGTSHRYGMAF